MGFFFSSCYEIVFIIFIYFWLDRTIGVSVDDLLYKFISFRAFASGIFQAGGKKKEKGRFEISLNNGVQMSCSVTISVAYHQTLN